MNIRKKRLDIKRIKKAAKGITLIALVVTIIVLLILAGVTLNLTIGQKGIFRIAKNATNSWQSAEQNEQNEINALANWMDSYLQKDPEPISKTESYIGCYADIDGNGTVDGIIYADLAFSKSAYWNDDAWGGYSYDAVDNLKEYTIVGEYKKEGTNLEQKPVIKAKEGTTGDEDRFYVMALEDFNPEQNEEPHYCWYAGAYGNLTDDIEYSVNDFGAGKQNTANMIKEWDKGVDGKYKGAKDIGSYPDVWGAIKKKVGDINNPTWFVPSKSEWAAFGDAFQISKDKNSDKYYVKLGLSDWYWSSSQRNNNEAYYARFSDVYIYGSGVKRWQLCTSECNFLIYKEN